MTRLGYGETLPYMWRRKLADIFAISLLKIDFDDFFWRFHLFQSVSGQNKVQEWLDMVPNSPLPSDMSETGFTDFDAALKKSKSS